jgi:hypothetical protein
MHRWGAPQHDIRFEIAKFRKFEFSPLRAFILMKRKILLQLGTLLAYGYRNWPQTYDSIHQARPLSFHDQKHRNLQKETQ